MKCEGCVHYRPFHGKPDSDEFECDLGMAFAYECMSNGFDKKKDRLKPCPFCGADAERMSHENYKAEVYYIRCSNDGCRCGETKHYWNEEDAVKAWNRRVSDGSFQLR